MPTAPTIDELISGCGCYSCLGLDLTTLAWLGASCPDPLFPPTVEDIFALSPCFACYGLSQSDIMRIIFLRNMVLDDQPEADVSPENLLEQSKCYTCLGLSLGDAFQIALYAMLAGSTSTSSQLFDLAKCFVCYGLTAAEALKIALLMEANVGADPTVNLDPAAIVALTKCLVCAGIGLGPAIEIILITILVVVNPPLTTCFLLWDAGDNIMDWQSGAQHIKWTTC